MSYNSDEIDELLNKYTRDDRQVCDTSVEPDIEKPVERKLEDDISEDSRVMSRAELISRNNGSSREVQARAIEKQRRRRRNNIILNSLLVFFILIFIGSSVYLGHYFYTIHKAQDSFDDLKALIGDDADAGSGDRATSGDAGESALEFEEIDGVLVQKKFVNIYKENNEFAGWLTIPGTSVDYPVMYTPDDEQKYLHLDFNQEYSSSGTLFVAAASDPYLPSDNVLVYGHNMKAGTMFHTLLEYESEEFYKEHSTFTFDTIKDNAEYEVIAAFRTKIDEEDDSLFKYYDFHYASNEEEFNEYVEKAKSMTPYNIEATATYGDKLVTLSTCAYHTNEGRYVIVAKKL